VILSKTGSTVERKLNHGREMSNRRIKRRGLGRPVYYGLHLNDFPQPRTGSRGGEFH
jgi:hypothetical protein